MVTGELKSKIDSLWEIFWTGGLTNPLDVIEQMTYLMFIHDLDDSDNTRAKEAAMLGLPYEIVPGVSSMSAAAAALQTEYTLPGVSQTVIVSRMAGRTPVPDREQIRSLARHQSTMVLFLSVSMLPDLCRELMEGGYRPDTPAAVVYRASWPDQAIIRGTLSDLPQKASAVRKTALVLVGDFLSGTRERSKLYDPSFTHGYR